MVTSKFVGIIQVIDPDSGLEIEIELRKLETGGMIGLDGAYLQSLCEGENPNNPYDDGKILIPQPFGKQKNLYEMESGFGISKFMIVEILMAVIISAVFVWLASRFRSSERPLLR